MSNSVLREIHHYWFGDLKSPGDFLENTMALWFWPSNDTDNHIRRSYGPFLADAAAKDWDVEGLSREEGVALVVVFDQFPRCLFRDSGEQFAYDPKARDTARRLIAGGLDRFFAIERDALSLAFQHHEDAASQDFAVLMAAELAVHGPENMLEMHRLFLDFACKHRDLVRKFGRYPHRNALLGRTSTPQELTFIQEYGRGY